MHHRFPIVLGSPSRMLDEYIYIHIFFPPNNLVEKIDRVIILFLTCVFQQDPAENLSGWMVPFYYKLDLPWGGETKTGQCWGMQPSELQSISKIC